jgi:hypothetical protein
MPHPLLKVSVNPLGRIADFQGGATATCGKAGQPNDVCPCGQVMLPSAMMFTS